MHSQVESLIIALEGKREGNSSFVGNNSIKFIGCHNKFSFSQAECCNEQNYINVKKPIEIKFRSVSLYGMKCEKLIFGYSELYIHEMYYRTINLVSL